MPETVRVRVSKWDVPKESHVSGEFAREGDRLGHEGNSDGSSFRYDEGHILSFSNPGGDKTFRNICKQDSEHETVLSGIASEFERGEKDVIPEGFNSGSKTGLEGSNSQSLKLSDDASGNRDKSRQTSNDNKVGLKERNCLKINLGLGLVPSEAELEDDNANSLHTTESFDVDLHDKEKLWLASSEKKVGPDDGNNEKGTSSWSPIPIKVQSEVGNIKNMQNTKCSDVDTGDRDKSWQITSDAKSDHKDDYNDKKSYGWGTSLGCEDSSVIPHGSWPRETRSPPPKIVRGTYRNRSRSRSRSRSPSRGYRRDDSRNDRNRSGPGFYRELCRAFMAGRCTRGIQCRYMHEDGGRNNSDRLSRPGADNQERYDRGTPTARDNKEYLAESKEPADFSLEKLSAGKRSRYDEDREDHNDCRNKKPAVQCMNFTRGKCYRGSACIYAHHDAPHDGTWHANEGDRERGSALDRGKTSSQYEHDINHEYRRVSNILCKFFPEGRCRNGDKCRFSHQGLVQSAPAGKVDEKWGSHGGNEALPTWNGPRWGEPVSSNAQSNVSGCGAHTNHAVDGASYASNLSNTQLQPQGRDAKYSTTLHRELQTVYPFQGQNIATETSRQHHVYDATFRSQSIEGAPDEHPAHVKSENSSYENASMTTAISIQNAQLGMLPFPGHSSVQSGQVISQALVTDPTNQSGQSHQFVPSNSLGSDPTGPLPLPKAQSHYFVSQATSNGTDLGSSSQYPSFGGQSKNVYPQPSIGGGGCYPPLQPVANVDGSSTSDVSQQVVSQSGNAVQAGHEKHLPDSNICRVLPSNVTSSNNKTVVTTEQMAQITNISASLAQIFGNGQQLPQFYTTLNPNAHVVSPMSQLSQPNSVMPIPCAAPPPEPHVDLLSQHHQNSALLSAMPAVCGVAAVSLQIPSDSTAHSVLNSAAVSRTMIPSLPMIGSGIGDCHGSNNSERRMINNKIVETGEHTGTGQTNCIPSSIVKQEPLLNPSEGGGEDPDIDKADRKDMDKDAKGIRMFKYALVDQVKEILKPIWKEGNMSKEVHKTIVKKVVDKVTGALQSNIPQTQERIDLYMEHSKEKLGKLVQAYVEKYSRI